MPGPMYSKPKPKYSSSQPASSAPKRRTVTRTTQRPPRSSGPTLQDIGKAAGDVSRAYAAGAAAVGRAKDEAISNVGSAIANRPTLKPPGYDKGPIKWPAPWGK